MDRLVERRGATRWTRLPDGHRRHIGVVANLVHDPGRDRPLLPSRDAAGFAVETELELPLTHEEPFLLSGVMMGRRPGRVGRVPCPHLVQLAAGLRRCPKELQPERPVIEHQTPPRHCSHLARSDDAGATRRAGDVRSRHSDGRRA